MGTHRYVATSFWDDEWIQTLDPSEKLLYLYLMTNPLTSISGVYKLSDRRISFDTGFNTDTIKFLLSKFQSAGKAYRMDEYIVLPTWPKHQKWESHSKIKEGIVLSLMNLGETYLRKIAEMDYRFDLKIVFDRLSIPYTYPRNYSNSNINSKSKFNNNTSGSAESESSAKPPNVDEQPPSTKKEKQRKLPLREREPVNDMERVEKTYLLNWDSLYAQGKVKAKNPVVNWNQTRKLLKTHFENINPDLIIQAVNNGLNDDFILTTGYSLSTMLSASVLNRLINTIQKSPPGLAEKETLTGLTSIF